MAANCTTSLVGVPCRKGRILRSPIVDFQIPEAPGADSSAEHLAFELGEDRHHAGQRAARRGGQVQRLVQRDEAVTEFGQLA
jgi:hypothetical protein